MKSWWRIAALSPLLFLCVTSVAQAEVREDIRAVATDSQFQLAVKDNVRHIVLTSHIDMVASQQEREGAGDSLDTGVVAVKSDTKSITVRFCS